MPFNTALVHFILVEMRSGILFYFSFKSLISTFAEQVTLHTRALSDFPDTNTTTFYDLDACISKGLGEALQSLNPDYVSSNGCIDFSKNHLNVFGWYNLLTLCVMSFLWITCLYLFKRDCGTNDFRSGKYMAFTYNLEDHKVYQIACNILVLHMIGGLIYAGFLFKAVVKSYADAQRFVSAFWLQAVAVLGTALALKTGPQIYFYYEGDVFADFTFARANTQMVTQSNNDFAVYLNHCILEGLRDSAADQLVALIPDSTREQRSTLLFNDEGTRSGGYKQLFGGPRAKAAGPPPASA